MQIRATFSVVLALTLTSGCRSENPSPFRQDLLGDAAPTTSATRTIVIEPTTLAVNVTGGEIIRFDVAGKSFAWHFDGPATVFHVDMALVAPAGMLDHPLTAYVAPDPFYAGNDHE